MRTPDPTWVRINLFLDLTLLLFITEHHFFLLSVIDDLTDFNKSSFFTLLTKFSLKIKLYTTSKIN